ncbi:hypothetical protein CEXT_464231 [Caerostris extrusa]|uniref:Uncharacterized protein n=1 Tax=Caerostris extrusa TaxID=172846 RepID=A0AAV4TY35_CAEEX|nr:hypothetical protein CEXT_464231 [Caerostris extrusa]
MHLLGEDRGTLFSFCTTPQWNAIRKEGKKKKKECPRIIYREWDTLPQTISFPSKLSLGCFEIGENRADEKKLDPLGSKIFKKASGNSCCRLGSGFYR